MTSPILVVGASGDVGRATVRALVARGAKVRVLVHATPLDEPGVESVRGDLADSASLARALEGCTSACFMTPHHPDEEKLGHNFVDACEAVKLRRLVFVSTFRLLSRSRWLQRVLDWVIGIIGPHYRAKLSVEARVRACSLSPVVLCPSNFYQNDIVALPEIRAGRYPNPMGSRKANRVDTRDIADGVVRALLDDVESGVYPIVGPRPWKSAQTAAAWSEAVGHLVTYAGHDIEQWRRTVGARLPASKAADFAKTYRVIQLFGIPATKGHVAQTTALLGHPPRDFAAFAREQVASTNLRAS